MTRKTGHIGPASPRPGQGDQQPEDTTTVFALQESVETWATRIRSSVARSLDAIIATGEVLKAAKAALPHGEWENAVRLAGLSPGWARKLISITNNPVITDRSHANDLPPGTESLYYLSLLPPDYLRSAIIDGTVRGGMGRSDAHTVYSRYKTHSRYEKSEPAVDIAKADEEVTAPPDVRDECDEWPNTFRDYLEGDARWGESPDDDANAVREYAAELVIGLDAVVWKPLHPWSWSTVDLPDDERRDIDQTMRAALAKTVETVDSFLAQLEGR